MVCTKITDWFSSSDDRWLAVGLHHKISELAQ